MKIAFRSLNHKRGRLEILNLNRPWSVTIAAGRIYAILRILRLKKQSPTSDLRRAAMFAAVPGENHTLGIAIAADLARDRGWDVEFFLGHSHDELVDILSKRDTLVIGLSTTTKRSQPALIKLIVALRISKPKSVPSLMIT